MQRKSGILNLNRQQNRHGFAMIMAIFFIIIISTLMLYMLESTTDTAKRTTNDYILEQGQLLAKSAVEYAILQVSGTLRTASDPCDIKSLNFTYPDTAPVLFDIRVDINYFGFGDSCAPLFLSNTVGSIETAESNGTMLIDVYVQNNPVGLELSEPIRYHRRTLQKL